MTIDLTQFHAVFFEESFEGLATMESELLELDLDNPDNEAINTIFRAAHSIKGGSGSFGFNEITDFTHVLETLLDQIRDGKRTMGQVEMDAFLKSVDCLRDMLTSARDKTDFDEEYVSEVHQLLLELQGGDADTPAQDSENTNVNSASAIWKIVFVPNIDLFKTGNDPLRLIRELAELGELESSADVSNLPPFGEFDPEESYLSWTLQLQTDQSEEQIKEIFEWVEDDCELTISKLEPESTESPVESKDEKPELKAVEDASECRSGTDRRKADRRTGTATESTSIRVDIDKVDALINLVGELVITQSMLGQFDEDAEVINTEKLTEGLKQLERNTRELQESVMQIRMLPISFSFKRFPRLVHDLSNKLNKKIELKLSGESTELDKTVMEKIGDPLVHLVRNSIDHGIETPEQRVAADKPETGILHLNAYHEGGNIVIEIEDDGAGLDKEKILGKAIERGLVSENDQLSDDQINELIFRPGFSTAEQVSDVSGRGVGMDVVRRNIKDLGGVVEVKSEQGKGSVFRIRLPLTLAILDGQLIRVGTQTYIVPLISIMESLQVKPDHIKSIAGEAELYRLRDDYIPIARLHSIFNVACSSTNLVDGLLVVVESEGQKVGLFVDDLLAQQQVVIKSLETNFQKVEGLSGATILGDGTVAMILDVSSLITLARNVPPTDTYKNLKSEAA